MSTSFRRVRIPETGAHWDCPESALDVLGLREHVIEEKPATSSAGRPKPKTPKAPALPAVVEQAVEPAEPEGASQHGENSR